MPAGVVKGPKSEEIWKRSKKIAAEGYPGLETTNPDRFYAITMTIYKAICKKHGCSPSEERTSLLLGRLELCEAVDLTFDDAIEELFDMATEQGGKLTRLDIGKELKDIGKNSAKYMQKALTVLKGLGVKIVAR
jgi:hypothetical protein